MNEVLEKENMLVILLPHISVSPLYIDSICYKIDYWKGRFWVFFVSLFLFLRSQVTAASDKLYNLHDMHRNSRALAQLPVHQALTWGVAATQEPLLKSGKPFILVSICCGDSSCL